MIKVTMSPEAMQYLQERIDSDLRAFTQRRSEVLAMLHDLNAKAKEIPTNLEHGERTEALNQIHQEIFARQQEMAHLDQLVPLAIHVKDVLEDGEALSAFPSA